MLIVCSKDKKARVKYPSQCGWTELGRQLRRYGSKDIRREEVIGVSDCFPKNSEVGATLAWFDQKPSVFEERRRFAA